MRKTRKYKGETEMKSFLVIGAGKFGHFICSRLNSTGSDVMIVDKSEDKLSDMLPYVASAKIGDCTKRSVLGAFGVEAFDASIVCIPEDFQDSLQIVDLLKELGAKRVIAVASTAVQEKFLLKNGADRVILPDRDMASRLAMSISYDSIFDYINLSDEYAIYELAAPKIWRGKTIVQVNVRKNYDINIVAIKNAEGRLTMPDVEYRFNEKDHLMVIGNTKDIRRLI